MAHTPTPWHLTDAYTDKPFEPLIASARGDGISSDIIAGASPDNAAFIVRACNAHDDLVAALEEIVSLAEWERKDHEAIASTARAALAKVQA